MLTIAYLVLPAVVAAQSTYSLSGCHQHGNVEYCFLPDGSETPWTTYAESSVPTEVPTSTTAVGAASPTSDTSATPTEATGCHFHETTQYCLVGDSFEEYEVTADVDQANAPEAYTNCHLDGADLHCLEPSEVTMSSITGASSESSGESSESSESSTTADGVSCHFHAGVEHCVDAEGNTVDNGCSRPENEYNVPLRIGLLFVILATSAIGVFLPMLTSKITGPNQDHIVLVAIRQFSAGVVISTAIVHLWTHAELQFGNECLGALEYEATTGAIVMAGLFISFLIEYFSHRIADRKGNHAHSRTDSPTEAVSKGGDEERAVDHNPTGTSQDVKVAVLESGIIFHSICTRQAFEAQPQEHALTLVVIGLTLVVAGDSGFITLFIVIIFHQAFEGFALGSRIAMLQRGLIHKTLLALAFAVTTPIGMAIGIGVLSSFNGNDPSTIIAIATLDALSAGILLWIGIVELWFVEWFYGALARANGVKVAIALFSLMSGLILMSVLGKWA